MKRRIASGEWLEVEQILGKSCYKKRGMMHKDNKISKYKTIIDEVIK
jgi:hypothetical protein